MVIVAKNEAKIVSSDKKSEPVKAKKPASKEKK